MEEGERLARAEAETGAEKEKRPTHYLRVVEALGRQGLKISRDRLRRLLNTEVIEGEKRRRKGGRGYPEVWFTTAQAVKEYRKKLLTPQEYGRKGGRPPQSKIGKRGVIFEGV